MTASTKQSTCFDKEGIPGQVPPHQLKKTLKQAGVDLEADRLFERRRRRLRDRQQRTQPRWRSGARKRDSEQAQNTVANLGLFLRSTGTPGITKISEGASGFSIRSPELGRQPVVVVAKDSRIAIGYGLAPTLASFQESGKTLADAASYGEALDALGGTPIATFVDGPAALNARHGAGPGRAKKGSKKQSPT